MSKVGSEVIGLCLGVASKCIASLGLVLQKRWHIRAATRGTQVVWYRDTGWIGSFGTYAMGNLLTLPALALAPQTIIAALDSLVLVFNNMWAPYILGEQPALADWGSVGVIIMGVTCIVLGAPPDTESGGLDGGQLLAMALDTPYLTFACIEAAVFALCLAVPRPSFGGGGGAAGAAGDATAETPPGGAGGDVPLYSAADNPAAHTPAEGKPSEGAGAAALLAACIAPAVLSSLTLQLAKAVGEMVTLSAHGDNQFADWPVYFLIILFILLNTWQVRLLQAALAGFSALAVVPLYQVSLTVLAVGGGGLYFQEFKRWRGGPTAAPVLFFVGLLLAVAGVVCIGLRGAGVSWVACCPCGGVRRRLIDDDIPYVEEEGDDEGTPTPRRGGTRVSPSGDRRVPHTTSVRFVEREATGEDGRDATSTGATHRVPRRESRRGSRGGGATGSPELRYATTLSAVSFARAPSVIAANPVPQRSFSVSFAFGGVSVAGAMLAQLPAPEVAAGSVAPPPSPSFAFPPQGMGSSMAESRQRTGDDLGARQRTGDDPSAGGGTAV